MKWHTTTVIWSSIRLSSCAYWCERGFSGAWETDNDPHDSSVGSLAALLSVGLSATSDSQPYLSQVCINTMSTTGNNPQPALLKDMWKDMWAPYLGSLLPGEHVCKHCCQARMWAPEVTSATPTEHLCECLGKPPSPVTEHHNLGCDSHHLHSQARVQSWSSP